MLNRTSVLSDTRDLNIVGVLPQTQANTNVTKAPGTDLFVMANEKNNNQNQQEINQLINADFLYNGIHLNSFHSGYRALAARRLGMIGSGSQETIQALIGSLRDGRSFVRREAVIALGRIGEGSPQAITALINVLQDQNNQADVRSFAAEALGRIGRGSPQAVTALISALQNSGYPSSVRVQAATALGKIGQGSLEANTALINIINSSEGKILDIRLAAIRGLERIGQGSSEEISTLYNAFLQGSNSDIRASALEALTRHVPNIIRLFGNNGDIQSVTLLNMLVSIGQPAVPPLINALKDQNLNYVARANAAQALAQIARNQDSTTQTHIVRAILNLLDDQTPGSHHVRTAACNALMVMGIQSNNQANGNPALAEILRNIALPRLRTLVQNDRREEVRTQANIAIEAIQ